MHAGAMRLLEGWLYRAALALCPDRFRREHGDEMARDFDEARREAEAAGGAVWIITFVMAVDIVRTVVVQWLRTGFPLIGVASIIVTLTLAEGLATVARRAAIRMPAEAVRDEVLGVLLLAVICVLLIAMTIILTQWASRMSLRGRR
jgi:hypothetical protein